MIHVAVMVIRLFERIFLSFQISFINFNLLNYNLWKQTQYLVKIGNLQLKKTQTHTYTHNTKMSHEFRIFTKCLKIGNWQVTFKKRFHRFIVSMAIGLGLLRDALNYCDFLFHTCWLKWQKIERFVDFFVKIIYFLKILYF